MNCLFYQVLEIVNDENGYFRAMNDPAAGGITGRNHWKKTGFP